MSKKKPKKDGRGGKRPNSGRHRIGAQERITTSITFDPTVLSNVDDYANDHNLSRSLAVEELCVDSLKKTE
jgi:hypothetical protein